MLTLHLANFPVRRWPWRVLAFALVETAAEMGDEPALIAAGREPLGSGRAHWHDWAALAAQHVLLRVVGARVFALVLAGVVQLVRYLLLGAAACTPRTPRTPRPPSADPRLTPNSPCHAFGARSLDTSGL